MASLYSMTPTDVFDLMVWRGITDSTKLIFLELWGLATQSDSRGSFIHSSRGPMSADDISFALRRDVGVIHEAIKVLTENKLLAQDEQGLYIPTFREANPTTQAERRRKWVDNKRGKRTPPTNTGADDDPNIEPGSPPDYIPEEVQETSARIPKDSTALSVKVKVNSKVKVNKEKISGSNEPTAPTSKPSKPTKPKKEPDPRSKHPAIVAFKDITQRYPAIELYDEIIAVCGDTPNVERMRRCWADWLKVSSNRANTTWVFEWYAANCDGNPDKRPTYANRNRQPVNEPAGAANLRAAMTGLPV